MPILRIQHSLPAYDGWQRRFDDEPVDRRGGGVRRYRIPRSVAGPNFVMVDLDFDNLDEAEAFLVWLRDLWEGPGKVLMQPGGVDRRDDRDGGNLIAGDRRHREEVGSGPDGVRDSPPPIV